MTKMVLLNCRAFCSGADLSGQGNKLEIGEEWEAKAVTNWRSGGAEELLAGLGKVDISGDGQWEAGDAGKVDDQQWANRRALEPWSMGASEASDTTQGSLMYLTRALRTKTNLWGGVGEVAGWSTAAKGTWPLVRGLVAHESGSPRTATGHGSAFQLGAISASQYLYANLHVLSVAGTAAPTITVTIESDSDSNFNTPTDRLAFAAATAIGGQAGRTAGAITDTWFQAKWTISGTNPSFLFLVTMGIE